MLASQVLRRPKTSFKGRSFSRPGFYQNMFLRALTHNHDFKGRLGIERHEVERKLEIKESVNAEFLIRLLVN